MLHVISVEENVSTAIQNDDFPLSALGRSTMERASDVSWDVSSQQWCAVIRPKFRICGEEYQYFNKSRAECIAWEIKLLNRGNLK